MGPGLEDAALGVRRSWVREPMSDRSTMTTVRVAPEDLPAMGATVSIYVDPGDMHLFSSATGERLN